MPSVDLSRVPAFYHKYIERVQTADLQEAFQQHPHNLLPLLYSLREERWNYQYADEKWTIREMVQHLIDAERIFCYRALRFARKDQTPLPGFEENDYVVHSKVAKRSSNALMEELQTVQISSGQLFNSFDEEQLNESGSANGNPIYVKAIGFIVVGHVLHHKAVLEERYLK